MMSQKVIKVQKVQNQQGVHHFVQLVSKELNHIQHHIFKA